MSHFSSEQLNFFKFSTIVFNGFPKALQQVFKAMWDDRSGLPKWDDSPMVRGMFHSNESGKMTHVPTDKSYEEWDCTALFEATLYARSFVKLGGREREKSLYDLYVKPLRLKRGAFHHSVWSHSGNEDETLALAMDQLRLLRNALCHQTSTQRIDNALFNSYLLLTKDAFRALRRPSVGIENLMKVGVVDFHATNIKALLDRLHKEKSAAIKSKQFENHLSEIETLCNTTVTDRGRLKFKENCGLASSEAKDSAANGKEKFAKQVQKIREKVLLVGTLLTRSLSFTEGGKQTSATFEADLEPTTEKSPRSSFLEVNPNSVNNNNRVNGNLLETLEISGKRNVCEIVVGKLNEALNFRQSEHISEARNKVREVFNLIERVDAEDFRNPTRYGLQVVNRGKDLFFDNSVSSSLKHGVLVLDSSNAGALFYASLLNILGVFALETSEFQITKQIFSMLVTFHCTSDATSRLHDLAAAFNNRGCLSLIMGEFNHAKSDFHNSLKHLNCEKQKQPSSSSTEAMIIGVHNNVCRLNFITRNFTKCLEEQEKLVDVCKSKVHELPIQTVFMVLHNQAMLNTALSNMAKAELELKWLVSYFKTFSKRERHDILLDLVSLELCEVLLLSGRPEEADNVYSLEHLSTECVLELMPHFGRINLDVIVETFEKNIDVLVQTGKLKYALECLQKQVIFVKERFGPSHFLVSSLLYKEGCTLKLGGQLSEAWEKFKCSADILTDIFGQKHPLLIKCYMSLGGVSLRLGRKSESHLSFQRAMENVEDSHQVSFPNQLSIRYMEMTTIPKRISFGMFQKKDIEEQMIDGLVAEHGLALAVLLSRLNPKKEQNLRGTTTKGKKPLPREMAKASQSEFVLIVSQKCARDLLLSGQTFLRLGMKNEAGAFFQLASKLCQANVQGQCFPSLVRLYNVISQTNFEKQNKVKENPALNRFLEELKEETVKSTSEFVADSSTEATKMLTLDAQMDLKLVLIMLILFSVQLRMHDTSFAAYALYAFLFPNDGWFFLTANDELQVYSSRTSVTCNGKTAVQYVIFSSAMDSNGSKSESDIPGNPLFRNLVCRKGMPTYSLLAIQTSSAISDVDDMKQVEQATLRSFQEYLEIKCLEEKDDTTQLIVDLSAISEKETFLASRRVELLPLCLSEEKDELPTERRDVHFIVPFLCEKTALLSFVDEPASCFMFGKIALWLFQECKWKKMSTLRVHNQCLVLTVLLPVKARVTLWYENTSVKQRVQIVFTEHWKQLSHGTGQKDSLCYPSVCKVIEEFFAPAIHHWTSTHKGPPEASAVTLDCIWSAMPTTVLHESCEPASFRRSFENDKRARKCLNAITLDGLTAISELTYLLHGDQLPEDAVQGAGENVVVPKVNENDNFFSFSDSEVSSDQYDQSTTANSPGRASICSYCQTTISNCEGDTEVINLSLLNSSASARAKENDLVDVTENARMSGRELFEKGRKSRGLSITKLQDELKKNEMLSKLCPLVRSECSPEEECVDEVFSVAESSHQDLQSELVRSESGDFPKHDKEVYEDRNVEEDEFLSESYRNPSSFYQKDVPGILQTAGKRNEQRDCAAKPWNDLICQSTREEKQKGNTNTAAENALLRKEKDEHFSPMQHNEAIKMVCDKQTEHVYLKETTQEKGVDIRNPKLNRSERYHTVGNKEVKPLEVFESNDGNDFLTRIFGREEARDDKETSLRGRKTDSPSSKISEICEVFVERVENEVNSDGRDFDNFKLGFTSSRRNKSHDGLDEPSQNAAKQQWVEQDLFGVSTIHKKDNMEMSFRSLFFGDDVVADGYDTDGFSDSTNYAGGPALLHSEVHRKDGMGASIRSRFLSGDIVADACGYFTDALPRTSQDFVDGPPVTAEKIHSGYPKIDGMVEVVDITANTSVDNRTQSFGSARPEQGLPNTARCSSVIARSMLSNQHSYQPAREGIPGLNPNFVARHAVTNDMFHDTDYHGAKWEDQTSTSQHHYSAPVSSNLNSTQSLNLFGDEAFQRSHNSSSSSRPSPETEAFEGDAAIQRSFHSLAVSHANPLKENESWHFPPLPGNTENYTQPSNYLDTDGCDRFTQGFKTMFDDPMQNASTEIAVMTTEFNNGTDSCCETLLRSAYHSEADSVTVDEGQQNLIENNLETRLDDLQKVMSRTVGLFASIDAAELQKTEQQHTEKVGIQEQAISEEDDGYYETAGEMYSREQTVPLPRNEPAADTEGEDHTSPVKESPRPACDHYQRRCLVRFPCCARFYPCHRCHNESSACTDDQARAINATHIRCTICYHEQAIDEGSQRCHGCNSKMSDYFCVICKHFTSLNKNPFHCDKCGICRIHRDKSFHCDVCNVCLDKRLQGKHKCRPDSGHDECCICLEDAFSGCQILPCSHKVHKDCAIAMIQNGIRTCPICRHPLFQQPGGTDQ